MKNASQALTEIPGSKPRSCSVWEHSLHVSRNVKPCSKVAGTVAPLSTVPYYLFR